MKLRIQFKLNTALLSYCPCVRVFVTGVTSHISHIYKGINAMLIIRGPIKPYIFWIKVILGYLSSKDQTRQDHPLCPGQPNHRFWLIKRISKNINSESAVISLSCSTMSSKRKVNTRRGSSRTIISSGGPWSTGRICGAARPFIKALPHSNRHKPLTPHKYSRSNLVWPKHRQLFRDSVHF